MYFCYDFPKTAKVVGKHTKKERKKGRKVETDIAFLLLYKIYDNIVEKC